MKISEYIYSNNYFDSTIIRLNNYRSYIFNTLLKNNNNEKYIYIDYSEDLIESEQLSNILNNLQNKIIFLCYPDIDFPPPKSPYKYDKYSSTTKLLSEHLKIDYYDKINTSIVNIIEKNNLHIFSHSVSIDHPNIHFIPIGIYNNFNHFSLKTNAKTIVCYMNMGIPCDRWFGNPRKKIMTLLKNHSFIIKKSGLSINEFYNDISKTKFMICPRGCGIDTYRLWDCIVLGCIPIVEKYNGHNEFNDLPILFLNSIYDFSLLTEDFLNNTYEQFLQRDFNYDKCKMSYWINKIMMDH